MIGQNQLNPPVSGAGNGSCGLLPSGGSASVTSHGSTRFHPDKKLVWNLSNVCQNILSVCVCVRATILELTYFKSVSSDK